MEVAGEPLSIGESDLGPPGLVWDPPLRRPFPEESRGGGFGGMGSGDGVRALTNLCYSYTRNPRPYLNKDHFAPAGEIKLIEDDRVCGDDWYGAWES